MVLSWVEEDAVDLAAMVNRMERILEISDKTDSSSLKVMVR